MRGVVLAVAVVACSYHGRDLGESFDGRPDAGPSRPDAPPGTLLWRMDTDVELAAGAKLTGASVIARGVVEPEAFAVGVLRVRSSNQQEFTDPAAVTWESLDGLTPAATSLSTLPLDDRRRPGGFGLDSDDTWTLWADGEIYLPSGVTSFALTASEHGFVDIAAEGSFVRVVASSGAEDTGSVDAPADGWYPVRMGLSDNTADARFDLSIDTPGLARQPAFPGWFRVTANTLTGVAFLATDEPNVVRRAAQRLYTGPVVDQDWGGGAPDMDLIGPGNFGTRWEGQVRIDTGGDHTFRVRSDDGHRLWIDGTLVSDGWTAGIHDVVTPPVPLAVGWHDVVLDHSELGGDASLRLVVESAPEAALVGAPIPSTRMRPVTGRGDRIVTAALLAGLPVSPDVDLDITTFVPPGATAKLVDVAVELDHPVWSEVHLQLTPPGGGAAAVVVFDNNADTRTGIDFVHATIPAAGNWTVGGRWRMRFTDDSGPKDGQARGYWLAIHYSGGTETVRTSSTWTSAVHDFGRPQVIDNVMWSAFVPDGASASTAVELAIRTCEVACTDEPWIDLPSSGSAPGSPAAAFAQVRATFTTDGTDSPWLDWVDVLARDP